MACQCRTGERTLIVIAPEWCEELDALLTFGRGDTLEVDAVHRTMTFTLGGDGPWLCVDDIVNFLLTIAGDDIVNALEAGWHSGCCSQPGDLFALEGRGRLVDKATADGGRLLRLLREDRIVTHFQPIFETDELRLWGHECLARGLSERGDIVPPYTMLKWAEAEHLTFMFDRVCRETHIANASRAGLPDHTTILINFMPTAIYDPSFCLRTTEAAVRRHAIDRSRIVFEAVESAEVTDREHLLAILGYYRRNGYRVALDDVGAGYAGLMMLADLNPDLIKIDRELVQGAVGNSMHQTICAALVEIGHAHGRLVLAEGVENEEEWELMRSIGVDLVQGFFFGRPSPEPALIATDGATRRAA